MLYKFFQLNRIISVICVLLGQENPDCVNNFNKKSSNFSRLLFACYLVLSSTATAAMSLMTHAQTDDAFKSFSSELRKNDPI